MHRIRLSSLVIAVALPLSAGCDAGADDTAPGDRAGDPDAAIELAPVDRSGVTGTVRADHGDEETRVALTLDGLTAGGAYEAHIHSGRCAAGGPVAAPIGSVTAEQDGTARLTREVSSSRLDPDQPAFVQVHDAAGEAVACADLPGHGDGDHALTDRAPTASPSDTAGRRDGSR